ncbi:MAG: hypothetical protein M1826_007201 [Phylliscum demangeonii]|nr:MAG: hypothetical protein M1826_007201 [Phylliscum demangeonii]
MSWSSKAQTWASVLLGPSLLAVVISTIIAISLPLVVHFLLYRPSSATSLPTFLILGPRGAGKTSFVTLLEQGSNPATHTSQAPLTVEASLPDAIVVASGQYRSSNDPTSQAPTRFQLIDTPGHTKLRHFALDFLATANNLCGVVFMLDAGDLSVIEPEGSTGIGLKGTAEYLLDVLLAVKRRSAKLEGAQPFALLVAANKLDLFTALPTPLIKTRLSAELHDVFRSRAKGLLDSNSGTGDGAQAEDEEIGVSYDVIGGHVMGSNGTDITEWLKWIGKRL